MNILVFGTGSVGGYLGGKLASAGHSVAFLGRETVVDALQADGVTVIEEHGTTTSPNLRAFTRLDDALATVAPELILLSVKSYDCQRAADALATVDPPLPILSLLNGVGGEALLERAVGVEQVISGTFTSAVETVGPGRYRATRIRGLGLARPHPSVPAVAEALREAGLKTRTYPAGPPMKWSMLLVHLMGNATAGLTGLAVGDLYRHPGLSRLEVASLREALRVMRAAALRPVNLPGAPVAWLAVLLRLPLPGLRPLLARLVEEGRGGNRPSLYWNIASGRTEIDWLNGAVVAEGERLGIPTPANRALTEAVHSLANRARGGRLERLSAEGLLERVAKEGIPELQGYNPTGSASSGPN